jgi:hypothetical protein
MAGSDETMRLVAEVVDKYSGPVREMQKAFRALQNDIKGVHTTGTFQAKQHTKATKDLHDAIGKARSITSAFTPTMATLGITAVSVSGSIAGLVSVIKGLGEKTQSLTYLARQTQLSTNTLRVWEGMAERVGSSAEEMDAGLSKFGDTMAAAGRDYLVPLQPLINIHGAMEAVFGSVQKLKGMSSEGQLNSVFDFLGKNYPVDQKRSVLRALGLPENFANASIDQLRIARAELEKWAVNHPLDFAKGGKSKKVFDELRESIQGLKDDLGGDFAPGLTEVIKQLTGFLEKKETIAAIGAELRADFKAAGDLITAIDKLRHGENPLAGTGPVLIPGGPADRVSKFLKEPFDPWGIGSKTRSAIGDIWDKPLGSRGHAGTFSDRFGSWPAADKDKKATEEGTKKGVFDGLMQFFQLQSYQAPGGGMPGATKAAYYPGGGGGVGTGNRFAGGAMGGSRDVPAGSGPVNSKFSSNKRQVAAIAASEWRKAGMPDTGTAGVMYNIGQESSFNPTLRHPDQPHFGGEAHFAHGLYQEGGTEWNHYAAWLQKNYPGADWKNPQLQSRFAAWNLKTNYPKVWSRMKNAKSRQEAAAAYASGYLKPAAGYLANRISGINRHGVPSLDAYTGGMQGQDKSAIALHGEALRRHFGHPAPHPARELLLHAQKAGWGGGTTGLLPSNATLRVDLNGLPRGTRTKMDHSGFKEVQVNRGRSMPMASNNS